MKKALFSLFLIGILVFSLTSQVFAADKKFLEQVRNEFLNYETKTKKKYDTYRETEQKKFEDYRKKENQSVDKFAAQTKEDLLKLDQFLKQDYQELKNLYRNNTHLTDYGNKINRYTSNSPMYAYDTSINRYYSNSFMYKYANVTNRYFGDSPMYKYANAVNQYSSNSPMLKYGKAVNRYSADSPMQRLDNNSSPYSSNSIMNKYYNGKISKAEATRQWKALLQKEDQNIQQMIKEATESLKEIVNTSKSDILKQKVETVNGILKQRMNSLQTISDLRTQYFGAGLSFNPLVPHLGEINVMLDGEWLGFEQTPIIQSGSTLVPMRAIFEKFEAEVKWHPETKMVTASKQGVNISLTLDKKTATINGKSVTLQVPPKLINGHTMVPLRFVSEALGAEVKWDGGNNTVFITSP